MKAKDFLFELRFIFIVICHCCHSLMFSILPIFYIKVLQLYFSRSDNKFQGYGKETRILANLSLDDFSWRGLYYKIKFFSDKKSNLFEFDEINYEELKLDVQIGENHRIINLNNLENLSIIENIPSEIRMADGLPNKDKLIEHFISVTNDYLGEMVLELS